jgi:membrane-bound lytic murein transglycosylase A
MRGARALAVLALLMAGVGATPGRAEVEVLTFAELAGWEDDNHLAALKVFRQTCDQLKDPEWRPICDLAEQAETTEAAAKSFFEMFFKPVVVGNPPALFTGYYEPELEGSPVRSGGFIYPIYGKPKDHVEGQQYYSRDQIDQQGILAGKGLELAWLNDPVDVYFLQIQGSGRIRMPGGEVIRVGYAGKNGHPYRSIGQALVDRGLMTLSEASAPAIRAWVKRNGSYGLDLLSHNPSYVFFRKLRDVTADKGPIGAMGRSITTLRSVAIDPAFVPLGAPVWVEKDGDKPMRRLMVAQDTGGAIKGAQRADIFYGTGWDAGEAAGMIKDPGRLVVLLPIDRAYAALLPED